MRLVAFVSLCDHRSYHEGSHSPMSSTSTVPYCNCLVRKRSSRFAFSEWLSQCFYDEARARAWERENRVLVSNNGMAPQFEASRKRHSPADDSPLSRRGSGPTRGPYFLAYVVAVWVTNHCHNTRLRYLAGASKVRFTVWRDLVAKQSHNLRIAFEICNLVGTAKEDDT